MTYLRHNSGLTSKMIALGIDNLAGWHYTLKRSNRYIMLSIRQTIVYPYLFKVIISFATITVIPLFMAVYGCYDCCLRLWLWLYWIHFYYYVVFWCTSILLQSADALFLWYFTHDSRNDENQYAWIL